jgi:hypothetical protein
MSVDCEISEVNPFKELKDTPPASDINIQELENYMSNVDPEVEVNINASILMSLLKRININKEQRASEFTQGVVYAAGIVIEVHDDPVIAQTVLSNANIDREAATKYVDEHDIKLIDKSEAWPERK